MGSLIINAHAGLRKLVILVSKIFIRDYKLCAIANGNEYFGIVMQLTLGNNGLDFFFIQKKLLVGFLKELN